jgi:hypothetical protein
MPSKLPEEHITVEPGWPDAWVCVCGNTPDSDGFYPCDAKGDEMEPVEGWDGLYVCADCGRIIHQETLAILGQNPSPKMLA